MCEEIPDVFRLLPPAARLSIVRRHLGPASGWWLRDKVQDGADIIATTTVERANVADDKVVLELAARDGSLSELRVDHVIAATGYKGDIDRLAFLDESIRQSLKRVGTMPDLSRHFESSVPNLYFAGLAAAGSFGPLMRFMVGAEFAAPRIATHIAAGRPVRRVADRQTAA